ncbi:SDR family NAD(P)-dependent oxidoreductase [Micrococcus terreus]|uniref:SDR family NAD(P)-dependent oxidoreductase n=1 Tax=Micrococcus terreus TaxID=574650 RepID=UPI0023F6F774|nr:SDR family oxidoreductase [Micrococcus terreus]
MTENTQSTQTPITARNTIQEWLDHPAGGPVLRGFMEQSGTDVSALGPALGMPLQQLVAMSQGKLPQEAVDGMVLQANGGVMPEVAEETPAGTGSDRFAGKSVIVTGAANGIGRATAERILREGGRVIAADISEERLAEFAQSAGTDQLVTVTADLTKAESVQKVIDAAGEQIHGLANVAGINDDFSAIHEVSDAMWAKVFAVNVDGLVRLTRAVTERMLAAKSGSIVHVSSEAGLRGSASGVAYTASKHAVIGITKSMAFMYAKEGIRTNVVAPGGVATGIPMEPQLAEFGNAKLTEARGNIPGLGTAEQLAASITFLLSDDGTNINGAVLASDGGWSAV